jgi:hypothetical protein
MNQVNFVDSSTGPKNLAAMMIAYAGVGIRVPALVVAQSRHPSRATTVWI